MVEKLLKVKAEVERVLLYATAKMEVVDELLAQFNDEAESFVEEEKEQIDIGEFTAESE